MQSESRAVYFGRTREKIAVACKAQDLGFTGIANIDKTYTAIHLDVRENSRWYGDEVVTSARSVCTDFYSYYGIKESENSGIDEFQKILNKKGANLVVDGIAGKNTMSAIEKFQSANNLGGGDWNVLLK